VRGCAKRDRRAAPWTCIAVSLALAPAARALASERADIAPGNWVRVTTRSEAGVVSKDERTATFEVEGVRMRVAKPATTVRGSVQSVAEEYLVLAATGGPIVVPRDAIWRLDVRRRGSKKGLGAVLGLFGGGAIGYAIGAASSGPGCQGGETGFAHLCVLDDIPKKGGTVLGAASGLILGVLVAPGEKWDKRVPRDHVHASIAPTGGPGIGLSLKLAF
jgi:hypothetical protein